MPVKGTKTKSLFHRERVIFARQSCANGFALPPGTNARNICTTARNDFSDLLGSQLKIRREFGTHFIRVTVTAFYTPLVETVPPRDRRYHLTTPIAHLSSTYHFCFAMMQPERSVPSINNDRRAVPGLPFHIIARINALTHETSSFDVQGVGDLVVIDHR